MLLSLSTTHGPATDLGYLLHKHPDKNQSFDVGFGTAFVLYPEASVERCTAMLLVEVDAERLARQQRHILAGKVARTGFALAGSINDRSYAASSLLAVAIGRVFGTALSGVCKERPELAAGPIALDVHLPVLSCRGGSTLIHRLFEPLGHEVRTVPVALDPAFPEWGDSRFVDARFRTNARLSDVLAQLYVLLPVLDDDKHYWVDKAEIDKLLHRGGDWLAGHPERDLIAQRYLRHQHRLTREALDRLVVADGELVDADAEEVAEAVAEATIEKPLSLNQQRLAAVVEAVRESGARTVADVGCGEGRLVERLLKVPEVERVLGVDVSMRALRRAADRLHLDTMSPRQRARVDLVQGSFVYRDDRLRGIDAVVAVEVIEHVDAPRLDAFVAAVFGHASPRTVVVTTPNIEYNVRFAGMAAGALRHRDHRFEWSRGEFASWAGAVAAEHGYVATVSGIGAHDAEVGAPTQMAVFAR